MIDAFSDIAIEPRHCLWRYEDKRKIPYTGRGTRARVNQLSDWAPLATLEGQSGYEGYGVLLGSYAGMTPLFGIDCDAVIDPETGELDEGGQELYALLQETYCERSPSGSGFKAWFTLYEADIDRAREALGLGTGVTGEPMQRRTWKSAAVRGQKASGVEACMGGYFTATRLKMNDRPIKRLSIETLRLVAEVAARRYAKAVQPGAATDGEFGQYEGRQDETESAEMFDACCEAIRQGVAKEDAETWILEQDRWQFDPGKWDRPRREGRQFDRDWSRATKKVELEELRAMSGFENLGQEDTPHPPTPASPALVATPFLLGDPRALPRRAFLYGDHLIRRVVTATVAPGGRGKSTLSISEDLGITSGRETILPAPASPCSVWHINLEEGRDELMLRMHAAAQHFGIANEDIGGRLYVDSADDIGSFATVCQLPKGGYMVQPLVDEVIAEMKRKNIDVLRVDPFILTHSVNENDNSAIAAVVNQFKRIAREANAAVHLVAHTRKAAANKTEFDAEDTRGGKALVDLARKVRVLNRISNAEAERFGISEASRWAYVRIDDAKQNLAPPAEHARWFRLESVTLPNGPEEDWNEGDKVGVAIPWTPTTIAVAVSEDQRELILEAMGASATWRYDVRSPAWIGYAVATALKLGPVEHREDIKKIIDTGLREGWLRIERAKDERSEERNFVRAVKPRPPLVLVAVNGEERSIEDLLGFDPQSAVARGWRK